ncbi:MAG: glutamyl-tRNA reductase [Acidobacteriota bacterium]|nr:glutamyl-tRNA reductase [Acidobacteriota bacterium]
MTEAFALGYPQVAERAENAERGRASFFLVGLNHRTAPVDVRERLSVGENKLAEVTQSLTHLPSVGGACVLSTCNRVEILVSSTADDAVDSVIDWLARYGGTPREVLEPHLYIQRGSDAVAHLFRVTSGLDSMIVGEPQIAGQVKKAFGGATLDAPLQQLFEQTMHVAKKVRSQTGIGEHAVSIPYAAIELAKKIFGDLTGLRVLLLGAGEIGELTAEHLAAQHVRQIFVANKTYERAVELSRRFGGSAVQFGSFEEQLAECDIVIASTGAPHYVIEPAQVMRALEARSQRGLFLVDLAVPRNIDPAIANIDGAYLYDVDDLQHVADANRELRRCKAARAEEIVLAEVRSFRRRLAMEDAVPTIVELQQRVDELRAAELEKCLRKIGPLRTEQREAIEQLSLRMMNKILHHPIVQLKEPSHEPQERESLRRTIRTLFGLTP